MMVLRVLAALFLFTMPQTMPQKTISISNGYLKAGEFLELNQSQKVGFAMGFVDGIDVAPLMDAPEDNKAYVAFRTCTAEMTANQVAAIIEKYIRDNPEGWHLQLHLAAYNSLFKACHVA